MSDTVRGMYFEDFEEGMTLRTITFKREIRKQDGAVVQEMEATMMYRCREGE